MSRHSIVMSVLGSLCLVGCINGELSGHNAVCGLDDPLCDASWLPGDEEPSAAASDAGSSTTSSATSSATDGARMAPDPDSEATSPADLPSAGGADARDATGAATEEPPVGPPRECYGAESCNNTGTPIGGGAGYSKLVPLSTGSCRQVKTKSELVSCLKSATSGAIVYVADDATIDLGGLYQLTIPPGVTLASGRGREGSNGALLKNLQLTQGQKPLLVAAGPGVRITGIRIQGPHQGTNRDYNKCCGAIQSEWPALEVDNCEIWGWPYAALMLRAGSRRLTETHVHHNFIHHNQAAGMGYGISLAGSRGAVLLVEANRFNWNRHDIAATGQITQDYEARYNIVEDHTNTDGGHSFDVHGGEDIAPGTGLWAGGLIKIHHNTFYFKAIRSIGIRGVPDKGAFLHHNLFGQSKGSAAIQQAYSSGHLYAYCNKVGPAQQLEPYTTITCTAGSGFSCASAPPSPPPVSDPYFASTNTCQ